MRVLRLLVCAFLLGAADSAAAQTRLYVNAAAPPGGNGLSWATAMNNLQTALGTALFPPVTEIWVARGRYTPHRNNRGVSFVLRDGLLLAGGFAGTESSLAERNIAANPTVLSGDLFNDDQPGFVFVGDNSYHVVEGSGVTGAAAIDGFTVSGGNATGSLNSTRRGGGLVAVGGTPTIRNCRFERNRSQVNGGAVWADSPGFTLESCVFAENTTAGRGGAFYIENGSATLDDCEFTDCGNPVAFVSASGEVRGCRFLGNDLYNAAGILALHEGASVLVSGCEFTGNRTTTEGGSVHVRDSSATVEDCAFTDNRGNSGAGVTVSPGSVTIRRCRFTGNAGHSGPADGAAVRAQLSAITLEDCEFTRNAGGGGGAVSISSSTGPPVRRCVFRGNHAVYGGAVHAAGPGVYPVEFVACDFVANTADKAGAGVYNLNGTVRATACRFIGNRTLGFSSINEGGAAVMAWDAVLANCLFTGNAVQHHGLGGAVYSRALLVASDCTLSGNEATDAGGGSPVEGRAGAIYHESASGLALSNCVLWGNTSTNGTPQDKQFWINRGQGATATFRRNCIEGWTGAFPGPGNFDADPLFIDPRGPDLLYGTEDDDPRLGVRSPARDAGENARVPPDTYDLDGDLNTTEPLPIDLDGAPRFIDDPWSPDTGVGSPPLVDLGAFESPPSPCVPDFDPNGVLDVFDFLEFQNAWSVRDPRADLQPDGIFDIFDFLVFQNLFARGCP